jgi:hypothetical protein
MRGMAVLLLDCWPTHQLLLQQGGALLLLVA